MLVSNSSTIILVAKITLLQKFLDEVKNVSITNVIYEEVLKKDSFENLIIKKEIEKDRIKIVRIEESHYSNILKQFKLDEGEASTFALYSNKKYKAVLTDDKELIKVCKINNIPFISAMAIIVRLFRRKVISKNEALEKMVRLQGYGRYSNEVYNYFRNMVK